MSICIAPGDRITVAQMREFLKDCPDDAVLHYWPNKWGGEDEVYVTEARLFGGERGDPTSVELS